MKTPRYSKSPFGRNPPRKLVDGDVVWKVKFIATCVAILGGVIGLHVWLTWAATGDLRCAVVNCIVVK
jgi:hypothetical protein